MSPRYRYSCIYGVYVHHLLFHKENFFLFCISYVREMDHHYPLTQPTHKPRLFLKHILSLNSYFSFVLESLYFYLLLIIFLLFIRSWLWFRSLVLARMKITPVDCLSFFLSPLLCNSLNYSQSDSMTYIRAFRGFLLPWIVHSFLGCYYLPPALSLTYPADSLLCR